MRNLRGWFKRRLPFVGEPPRPAAPAQLIFRPLVVRRDARRTGVAVFVRPLFRQNASLQIRPVPAQVVRRDSRRPGQATFSRPPLTNAAGQVLPPRVVRSDARRRGTATFSRPPWQSVSPPLPRQVKVVRWDAWRDGQASFIRPPAEQPQPRLFRLLVARFDRPRPGIAVWERPAWRGVVPPLPRPAKVIRSDAPRAGQTAWARFLVPRVNVAGGVLPVRVVRSALPDRLRAGEMMRTWLFDTGLAPPSVPLYVVTASWASTPSPSVSWASTASPSQPWASTPATTIPWSE